MRSVHYVVSWIIRLLLHLLCKIDWVELHRIPSEGPCIIVTNHINFLEVPLLYTHLMPRKQTSLVKKETWNNPVLGFLANLWQAIPIARGVIDRTAIAAAHSALEDDALLVITPEGTRSGNGKLRRGNPGVILLATDSGVPVFPLAHHGGEQFWRNFKSLRRTSFVIRVGRPFLVETEDLAIDRGARRQIADEIMCRIAELLPEFYRGYYDNRLPRDYQYLKPI